MRGQRHYGIVTIGDDIIAQASQCIANLRFAVKGANSSLADVVRVRYVLPKHAPLQPRSRPASPTHVRRSKPTLTPSSPTCQVLGLDQSGHSKHAQPHAT